MKGGFYMKIMKKRWVKIACIMLTVALIACFIAFGLFYWRVKHSILGEIGIDYVFDVEKICMTQDSGRPNGYLDQRDRKKLFMILSHTRKYDKQKDRPYLLEGNFLYGPFIKFRGKDFHDGQRGNWIHWDYHEGIFVYDYLEPEGDKEWKHSRRYYLEKKYAQELRVLFDKYTFPSPHHG